MYLFGDTDPLYRRNFEFFVEHTDADGGGVDSVIFMQVVRMLTQQNHEPGVKLPGRVSSVGL